MPDPADSPDLEALLPMLRPASEALQNRVSGPESLTERQDHLIAELHHALFGKQAAHRYRDPISPV
ncbi:hypothetical protein [Gemmobacter sp. 24YEA27]|uniref:hypothetical protein n=1 Tax=Gemmobacter sp. 24YEA27 TaxID=3040672 RepID=UPI0024B36757|nr:hypothetical protein [Gemmobacter sp. 24YEA27]